MKQNSFAPINPEKYFIHTLWYLMIPCDTQWYFVIPCDTLWYLVILYDTLWYLVILCDTLWYFVMPCDTLCYLVILRDTLWYFVMPCDTLWYLVILRDTLWCLVILCDTLWYLMIPWDTSWYLLILFDTLWYVLCLVTLRVLKPGTDTKICERNLCHLIWWVYGRTDRHDIGVTSLKTPVKRYSDCVSMWCDHKLCVLNQLSPNRALYIWATRHLNLFLHQKLSRCMTVFRS